MSERPHSRKRNDSGKTGEVNRRGEGLGKKNPSGNSGRGQNVQGSGLFGSGKNDGFDLDDVMKILKSSQSHGPERAGGGFDISDLLNGLQSNSTHVTNNNNIDITDLINLLQNQAGSGSGTITNNNNISMDDLLSALNNQNNYVHGSQPSHGSISQVSQAPQTHSQPSSPSGNAVPLNSGSNKRRGGGNGFFFLLIILLVLFFVFGRGGCSGGGGSSTINTNTNTNTNTNENTNPNAGANTASTWNYGTAVSHANTYVDASSTAVNNEVASGSRKKYTTLVGNGNDQVTMLVYMCGTDLESNYGMATQDLTEMAAAVHSDKINIIVETGGTKTWRNRAVTAGTNQIWRVVDNALEPLESNLGRKAMTDPATLAEFIRYGAANYPANRYILVFWDHGGGSVTGYGYDELYPNGSMPVDRIQAALEAGGVKFDIIGFDACLMANMETAVAVEPYGDYLLASEETEPGTGWYYTDWLTKFAANSSMSSLEIGQLVIDDFCTKRQQGASSADKNTLSLIDLAEFKNTVPSAMSAFAKKINSDISNNNYRNVSDARSAAREFGQSNKLDQIDLIHFCSTLNTSEAKALVNTLKSCVKYNRTKNITNAYGISIYFPYRRTQMVNSLLSIYNNIGFDTDYAKAVRSFASLAASGQVVSGSTSNSLYNLLGGSAVSNGTSYESLDLSSLLGGGSGSSAVLDQLLGGSGSYDTGILDLFSALYGRAHIDSEDLVLTEKNGNKVLALSEDDWSLIQSVKLNVWVDDDGSYVDLGADNIFEFDEDGDLVVSCDGMWLALNDQIVPYYMMTDEYVSESDYKTTGYIPALLNGNEVHLIVEFSDEYETGKVLGAEAVYDINTEGKLMPVLEGDVIEFIADCYNPDGTFDDAYLLGEPITVELNSDREADLTISDMTVSADRLLYGYELTDVYGAVRYTPFEEYFPG